MSYITQRKRKPIALATADIHTHNFRAFNDGNYSRLFHTLNAISYIGFEAIRLGVPLLIAGDLVHNNKEIENPAMSGLLVVLKKLTKTKKLDIVAISGNHDFFTRNTPRNSSPSYLHGLSATFKRFHEIDNRSFTKNNLYVYGVPYYDNDSHLADLIKRAEPEKGHFNVLMLHCDAPGARTPEGIELGEVEHIPRNMDSFFKDWDLVIMGHIHKPQRIGKKVIMCGPPIHQDRSSIGHVFGYWVIYDDGSVKLKSLNDKFPCFVPEGLPHKDIDYIIPKDEEPEEEEIAVEDKTFNVNSSSNDLAKGYLKEKGIKDKKRKRALIQVLNEAR